MDKDQRIAELEKEVERLECLLRRDQLSGVLSRGEFEMQLGIIFESRRADDPPFGVVFLDIDHFKRVNDKYGHKTGDAALHAVAQCIQTNIRRKDTIVSRYGGDEFAVIAPHAKTVEGLMILSERVRGAVEMLKVPDVGQITVSVGYALQREGDKDGWDAVNRADQALYRAKNAGRNRISA